MNQRNVEALAALLREIGVSGDMGGNSDDACEWFAKELASRGVLVPSALTDEDANKLRNELTYQKGGVELAYIPTTEQSASQVRADLERCANGNIPSRAT